MEWVWSSLVVIAVTEDMHCGNGSGVMTAVVLVVVDKMVVAVAVPTLLHTRLASRHQAESHKDRTLSELICFNSSSPKETTLNLSCLTFPQVLGFPFLLT